MKQKLDKFGHEDWDMGPLQYLENELESVHCCSEAI